VQSYPFYIWKQIPCLRVLVCLTSGLLIGRYFKPDLMLTGLLISVSWLLLYIFRYFTIAKQISLASCRGLLLISFIVSISAWLIQSRDVRNSAIWVGHTLRKGDLLQVSLIEPPAKKQGYYRSRAEVEGVYRSGDFHSTQGFLWIYFPKNAHADSIGYGSRHLLDADINLLSGPAAPGLFDFREYSGNQQIFHSVRLRMGQWKCITTRSGSRFFHWLYQSRERLLGYLSKYVGPGTAEAGIAQALVLGFKEELDSGVLQSYSDSGVIHIIAISGMHLALIQWVLAFLLGKLSVSRFPLTATVLNMLALWLFALLTGGSASIIRSAVMFSIMLSGKLISRDSNACNTLAASALLMLLYEPLYLWDAGFILSHLAVLGLVLLQQPIQGLYYNRYKWIRKIWELNAITLSAQVFTLPYCLYLFRQFPNYFILANLLVVPISSFILIAGLLLISFGWIGPVSVMLGKLIAFSISVMSHFVVWVSRLPKAVSFFPQFGLLQTLSLYLVIIFALLFLSGYSGKMFRPFFLFTLLLCGLSCIKDFLFLRQQKVIIYKLPRGSAIDVLDGPLVSHFSYPLQCDDSGFFKKTMIPCRRFFLIQREQNRHSLDSFNVIRFAGKKIISIDGGILPDPEKFPAGENLLLIRNNGVVCIDSLQELYHPSLIVFDASNKMWKIERWQTDCERLHLRNFSIPHQGSLVLDADDISNRSFHEKNSFSADLSIL